MAGPGFQASRTEASTIVPEGSSCNLPGARVGTAAVERLQRMTGTPQPLSVGNTLDVGTAQLASYLPFLFQDTQAPAAPTAAVAARTGKRVTLTWTWTGRTADLAGYDLHRTIPGGAAQKLNTLGPIGTNGWVGSRRRRGAGRRARTLAPGRGERPARDQIVLDDHDRTRGLRPTASTRSSACTSGTEVPPAVTLVSRVRPRAARRRRAARRPSRRR